MKDYYKILNLPFEASEDEIKKQFRKLAMTHHPDKNGGSKESEERLKSILQAYETLSNKETRAIYDLKYKKNYAQSYQQRKRNGDIKEKKVEKSKLNYLFVFLIVIGILIIHLYNNNKKTTTGNPKADKELEEQKTNKRPQSGELDFRK